MKHLYWPLAAMVAMPLALAGCGPKVDDPANPPRLGHWIIETKLDAISINNMNIGRSMVANEAEGRQLLTKIESKIERRCIEPMLNDEADLIENIATALDDCAVTDTSLNGTSRHTVLACSLNGDPVEAVVDTVLDSETGHNRIRATSSKPKASGGQDRLSVMINQTLTRAGDCN